MKSAFFCGAASAVLASGLVLGGCSSDNGDPDASEDTSVDAPTEVTPDTDGDVSPEVVEDAVEDPTEDVAPDRGPDVGPPPFVGPRRITGGIDLRALERRGVELADLDFSGTTHLSVGFATVAADGTCAFGSDGDADAIRSLIVDGGPAVAISVGGFGMGSEHFSAVASTDETRERFASTCAALVASVGAGGLDVSWETPVLGGIYGPGGDDDWPNYVELLRATRAGLDDAAPEGEHYELSFFGPGDLLVVPPESLREAVDIVDSAATLSFDFAGTWQLTTGFASSLFAPFGYSVDLVVSAWRETGADVSKLSIGVPLYGWAWADVSSRDDGLEQVASGPAPGTFEAEPGLWAYDDLEPIPTGFERFFDDERQVPWLYSNTQQIFVSYEDRVSMQAKADFVVAQGLRGVVGWDMSLDRGGALLPVAATVFEAAASED
ncbi:MAG: glycoside hydrolase family 18 protein [Myxococcales bacterium]|nr:glycoside hydrolase family 18 protein [Myxococcales bacterium]MCB9521641.1 glycoside hydrolase family 18 protein [Myxococcales bacterium]MCB9531601.1 glycoside hydrolase family 18 protein [Myxococcales bacterium]MCB9532747.1 glycoside hydrolase family 18 protein [Myxococcales bacterium]